MVTSVDATYEQPEPTPARGPVNFLLVLWQRKWLVALGLTVGLVVGLIVASRAQPVYRSSAQVLVIKKRSDVVPVTGGDPSQAYLEDYMSTHMTLLKSPVILEKAVKKGGLAELPTFAGQADPARAIGSSLVLSGDSNISHKTIIDLSYQGPVAEDTTKVLQAVIDSYRDFVAGAYRNVSKETEELIKKAQDVLKKDLEVKEKEYRAFREQAPLLLKTKDGLNVHQARVAEIEAKRSELVIRKAELEGSLKAVEEARKAGKALPAPVPLTEETDRRSGGPGEEKFSAEELLAPLLLEEQSLLEDYGDDHPKVRAVRAKIAFERKLMEQHGLAGHGLLDDKGDGAARYVAAVKQQLGQIDVSEKSLKALLDTELTQAKDLNRYEIADEGYRGELERSQQLYEATIRRLQEINLVRDFAGYDAEVISPPGPGQRVAPSLLRVLILAVVLGLAGGVGLAYLADLTDKSFRTAEEIRRRLGLTVMGHIPFDGGAKHPPSGNGEAQPQPAVSLCVHQRPASPDAEAYRGLRTALYFATQGEGWKVIQVTSPSKGDGKTTLLANLGVTIAQSGKRVILVDADFRRPRLDRLFGVKSPQGLTAVLAGEADPTALTRETKVPGLFVLPCGERRPNPAELLTSACFGKLLGELRENYDYVLVDSPPLLAVTDPCIVAGQVEAVLLAIRVSKNGRPAAERAKEMLAALGARVLGVVVNGIGPDAARSGYGYRYYSYDYQYKDGYQDEAEAAANGTAKPQ